MAKALDKLSRWILAKFLYVWLFLVSLIAALVGVGFALLPLSDAIQALFLAIQSMLMFVLVLVTWWYARETARISRSSEEAAKAAAEQAEASKKMAEEMRQQRLTASQPVIWPTIWGWDDVEDRLDVHLVNVGNGPALDIDFFLGRGEDPMITDCEHKWKSYIAAGDKVEHSFLEAPYDDKERFQYWAQFAGKYTLVVEWRDLYESGPFFQATLPFTLELDPHSRPLAKEGIVNIKCIPAKRKPFP